MYRKSPAETVFNFNGDDLDFRVEGDTDENLIFVDASADEVGIGTATPGAKLDVRGSASFNGDNADADFLIGSQTHDDFFEVDASTGRLNIRGASGALNPNQLSLLNLARGDSLDTSYRDISFSQAGSVEPTEAITQFTESVNSTTDTQIAQPGNRESMVIVGGSKDNDLSETFLDVVFYTTNCSTSDITEKLTFAGNGTAPTRTYKRNGSNLDLRLASGSGYGVKTLLFKVCGRKN